jgi:chromosome segregation ATPase
MQRRLAAESERAGAAEQRAQAASEADERADALQREAQELRSQLESQKAEHQAASEEMQQTLAEERKRADAAEQEAKFASEARKRANESEREDLEMRADMAERELDNIRQLLDVQNFTEKGDEGERREHENGTQTQDLCEAVHKLQRRMNEAEHSAEERARAILNQQRRADELAQYLSVAQTELEEERERLAKKYESEQLIAKLQNELAEKEQQVADTQVEISSLAAQLAEQQNRAIGAEEDASNIRKELQSMDERTRAQLQHMEQRALSAESEESEEMARLKHELSSREKEVEELRSENQRLSDQTESMEIRDEQIKSLNASLQESKKKLQKAVQKGKQKESQLKEVMHKRDELQSMLEKEQDEHGRLRAEMAKLSGFNCEQIKGAWTDALDSIAERLKYVQMKNDDSVADGLHRDNHFSVHDEQQRLEAAEAQIATLKERNEHLENCISSTCDLIGAEGKGDLEEKAWQLNSRVDELNDEWREAFESQRSVHEDLNNQFHKLAQELGTEEEVTAMQQVARECTGAQERLEETQKELQSVQTELEETRQRFHCMDGQLRSVLEVEVGDELIAKAQETQSNMRLWEKEAHNIQRHFENEKKRREHLEQSMQSGVGEYA